MCLLRTSLNYRWRPRSPPRSSHPRRDSRIIGAGESDETASRRAASLVSPELRLMCARRHLRTVFTQQLMRAAYYVRLESGTYVHHLNFCVEWYSRLYIPSETSIWFQWMFKHLFISKINNWCMLEYNLLSLRCRAGRVQRKFNQTARLLPVMLTGDLHTDKSSATVQ